MLAEQTRKEALASNGYQKTERFHIQED